MEYEKFKGELVKRIKDYLPLQYQDYIPVIERVNRINVSEEVLLLLKDRRKGAAPSLYISKYYHQYKAGVEMETVIINAALEFMRGELCLEEVSEAYGLSEPEKNIIYVLVNTERNRHMLSGIPHRQMLDLSLIYRLTADVTEEGLNSAIVTDQMAADFGMDEETLYRAAVKNTPRIMPPDITEVMDNFYAVGNSRHVLGAAAMIYDGLLENMAEMTRSDLYIIPASIHELYVLPAEELPGGFLRDAICDANRTVLQREDVLSDNLYHYGRREGVLTVAI